MAAHRAQIPTELRTRNNWVRWDAAKVPLRGDGRRASSTDPCTWSSFSQAKASSAGVGVGFVLDGTGLVCVDLDHALVDGKPLPWCTTLLASCPATWIEVSPSGEGLHVWGHGTIGKGQRIRRGEVAVEVYDRGRYLTVTGRRFNGAPSVLADLTGWLTSLGTEPIGVDGVATHHGSVGESDR